MRSEPRAELIAVVVVVILYGLIIVDGLLGNVPDDRAAAWLLLGVLLLGMGAATAGRLRPGAIARALYLMAASQVAAGLLMLWRGLGTRSVVVAVNVILTLIVATLGWHVRRTAARED